VCAAAAQSYGQISEAGHASWRALEKAKPEREGSGFRGSAARHWVRAVSGLRQGSAGCEGTARQGVRPEA